MRICEKNSSADTQVNEEGGGDAVGAGADIPLQPVLQPVVRSLGENSFKLKAP